MDIRQLEPQERCDILLAQLERIDQQLNAPIMTREQASNVPVPEGRLFHQFPATIGGRFQRIRLVPDRDGTVSFNVDYSVDRHVLIQNRRDLLIEYGLTLVEMQGIIVS